MVKQCVLCRKIDYLNPNKSFHSIPTRPDVKRIWLKILEFPENEPLPKAPLLCSDHFGINDFIIKSNGVKYLRKNVLPRVNVTADSKTYASEERSSSEIVSGKILTGNLENMSNTSSSPKRPTFTVKTESDENLDLIEAGPSGIEFRSSIDPSSTLSASEVERENLNLSLSSLLEKRFVSCHDPSSSLSASEVEPENFNLSLSSLLEKRFVSCQDPFSTLSASEFEHENFDLSLSSLLEKRPPQPYQPNSTSALSIFESEQEPQPKSIAATLSASDSQKNSNLETGRGEVTQGISAIAKLQVHRRTIKVKPKKRKRYNEDLTSSDCSIPAKAKENFIVLKGVVICQRKKIKSLQNRVRRLKARISSLNDDIKELKQRCNITNDTSGAAIMASVPTPVMDIFEAMLCGASAKKYTPIVRLYALTLAFYSASAYNFVRRTFNNPLPRLKTVSKWFRSADGFLVLHKNHWKH